MPRFSFSDLPPSHAADHPALPQAITMQMVTRWVQTGAAGAVVLALNLVLVAVLSRVAAEDATTPRTLQPDPEEAARHFDQQTAPLLARHGLECHNTASPQGGLDLSRREGALSGGESGAALVLGKASESLLWQYVEADEMPQGRPPLSPQEKQTLRQWIDSGAAWTQSPIDPAAHLIRRRAQTWLQRLTLPQYIQTVRETVGVDIADQARQLLPPDVRADGFSNTAYSQTVDLEHVEAYAHLAHQIVKQMDVAAFADRYTDCRSLDDNCMRPLIAEMGKWILRGPLTPDEVETYLRIPQAVEKEQGTYAEAVGYLLEAMLQSPRFLYRLERQQGDQPRFRPTGHELASRLSYILWGGPPDEQLRRLADEGKLSGAEIERQVDRMLADPRAIEQSTRFLHQWMDLGRLPNLRPSAEHFPDWDPQLAADMQAETIAFFREVAWQQQRPLADLLNAQVTVVSPRLAEFYGLSRSHAVPTTGPAAPQRVSDGLQALYLPAAGEGDYLRDRSGHRQPLDLAIGDPSQVSWEADGLRIRGKTQIATPTPPRRLIEALRHSGQLSLEVWITPANVEQAGPARILTLSANSSQRNFTLGQDKNQIDARLRTTSTDRNGMPSTASAAGTLQTRPTHVVFTRDASGKTALYTDGQLQASQMRGGELSTWDPGFRLALGNELSGERPWQGVLHLAAIYSRALSASQVQRNLAAGYAGQSRSAQQAVYLFQGESGKTIPNHAPSGREADLEITDLGAARADEQGLTIHQPARLATREPPRALIEAIKRSGALTIEAWVTPANTAQNGPARIVSLSQGTGQRNFTLGQDTDRFEVRLRTTQTSTNGLPAVASPSGSAATRICQVVYTRDPHGLARLYVDGQLQAEETVPGDLSNWDENFTLSVANETSGDRPWLGTLHRVAIYSRSLTPDEITTQSSAAAWYDLASVPERGGLLTQGSTLTIGGDHASMVTRGLFILHELLYSQVGQPPPCADTSPVATQPGLTQRAIAIQRINDASCGGCHSRFEPLAFGLERFDGIGAYHEVDRHGNPLRHDGEIVLPGEAKPARYETSAQLMDILAASPRVQMGLTRKVTQFALGRPLVQQDQPLLEAIHREAQKHGGTYASLIKAIVLSDFVQTTSSPAGDESSN